MRTCLCILELLLRDRDCRQRHRRVCALDASSPPPCQTLETSTPFHASNCLPHSTATEGTAARHCDRAERVGVVVDGGGGTNDQPSLAVQLATHSHSSSHELGLGSASSGSGGAVTVTATPAHAHAAARPDTLSEVTLEMKEEEPQDVPASVGGTPAFNLSVDADPAEADPSPPRCSLVVSPGSASSCLRRAPDVASRR